MAKAGTADDNLIPALEQPVKLKPGAQEDGSYVDSKGVRRPPKEPRRVPYDEPEEVQVDGHELIIESPDGSISFSAHRMDEGEFQKAGYPDRKRLKCLWKVDEIYSGRPRPHYSYDELEQLKKGELKR